MIVGSFFCGAPGVLKSTILVFQIAGIVPFSVALGWLLLNPPSVGEGVLAASLVIPVSIAGLLLGIRIYRTGCP